MTSTNPLVSSSTRLRPAPNPFPSLIERARRAPRLTREQERELITNWQAGDRRSGERLARASLRYVVSVAFKFRRYNQPVDVLISEGNLGLVRAMAKFDLKQETRFSTYAMYWIRYYIIDHIMRTWSMVGGGSGALKTRLFFRLRRERARAWCLHGDSDVAQQMVADRLGVSKTKLARLSRQLDQHDLSLDVPVVPDAGATLLDTLSVNAGQETILARREFMQGMKPALAAALSTLNARERAIVEQRLMADAEDEVSLAKLGESFGVSRERVRQLEEGLKAKLRALLAEHCSANDLAAA